MQEVGFTSCIAAVLLFAAGCSEKKTLRSYANEARGHRLVRISFRGQHGTFKIRVDQDPVERIENSSFTNTMEAFNLEFGDIVVGEAERNSNGRELSWPPDISQWWFGYLGHVKAAHYSINSDNIRDFFASPLYHWTAPFEKPRPLKDVTFYDSGQSIGKGPVGFRKTLDLIETQKKSNTPFILAPRIRDEGSYSPWQVGDQMGAWCKEAGVSGFPNVIAEPDFGRLMDK